MADRRAKTSKVSENPKEVVELDKDERWQARLEEARARREVSRSSVRGSVARTSSCWPVASS